MEDEGFSLVEAALNGGKQEEDEEEKEKEEEDEERMEDLDKSSPIG